MLNCMNNFCQFSTYPVHLNSPFPFRSSGDSFCFTQKTKSDVASEVGKSLSSTEFLTKKETFFHAFENKLPSSISGEDNFFQNLALVFLSDTAGQTASRSKFCLGYSNWKLFLDLSNACLTQSQSRNTLRIVNIVNATNYPFSESQFILDFFSIFGQFFCKWSVSWLLAECFTFFSYSSCSLVVLSAASFFSVALAEFLEDT